jgi:asparagine synthase (glutamine-hydrolysing)
MCGFYGQFNTPNLPEPEFKKLLALGAHRGPDQTGFWEGERVQFGFNRLAILDLTEAGHQPMRSPNGKFMVVFNGEIYNHLDLRKKLPRYQYRGHSDTETICHALEVWGVRRTVESLDGMFALAIYQVDSKELCLARDFAGIKPLFFGHLNGAVVFSSQYDQLKAHPLCKSQAINEQVLKLYLQQHFVPAPFGLHKNLHQVRPGEIVSFSAAGEMKKQRYWELPDTLPAEYITDQADAQKVFSEAFATSVNDQLVADVPLGAFLSGGVDSPLVCSYATEVKKDIDVFSIGSDSKVHDESERATAFAKALKLNQHLWKLDATEMLSYWDEATLALHEPLADFSILPTYLVSKLARKHVTVALSGDGGDELFFGYERFWSVGKNQKFHNLPAFLRKGMYGADKIISSNKNVNSLLTVAKQGAAHQSLHSRFSTSWMDKIAPALREVALPEEWDVYAYANCKNERELMAKMRKAEFYGMMQKTLRKVDLASMQNSLEVRVPFLQKTTIEAALRIDPMLSYGPNKKKEVLKQNLLQRIPNLPDDNVKRGFTIPLGNWIREGLREKFETSFEELAKAENYFYMPAMNEMLNAHAKGGDLKWPLFTLYSLAKQ